MADVTNSYRRLLALLVVVVAGVVLNCSGPDSAPCYGVAIGNKLDITIVDTYDTNSQYSWTGRYPAECGFGFDLTQGQVLHATVVSARAGDNTGCQVGFPEFTPFDGWTWARTPPGQSPTGGTMLDGAYWATRGSCSSALGAVVEVVQSGDPFQPSVPGQRPRVVLKRVFNGGQDATTCPGCLGHFVVDVKKL
ncbi:MAG: hypothetical protein M3O50_13715 [Myxococcota bacterium]|nr:hypothetical protein [Myxococcota bacterium]